MVTTLELATLRLPMTTPGADSPLPLLTGAGSPSVPKPVEVGPGMAIDVGFGQSPTLLPYHAQDDYGRELAERDCPVALLRNEFLTATFLLSHGGRLWSLLDRRFGRELLHRPEALRLANFGLRNAWFAGGVEWNLGTTGHWPLTCSPVHAGRVQAVDGTPILRMWEFERMRRLVWRIDAWLPPDSRMLYVRPQLHNPHPHTVPVYWWSNAAVPETDGTRVLAPAGAAFHFGYDSALRRVPFPHWDGHDRSYPARSHAAADYFLDLPAGETPWIASVDEHGTGLMQASTRLLRGRKLFLWGGSRGGRRWQQWLSGPGRYLEIQAGLARTQLEHLPLGPKATWSWTESYGAVSVDPGVAHGPWAQAVAALADIIDPARLDAADALVQESAATPPEVLARGQGWGALEVVTGGLASCAATPFPPEALGADQQPWLRLWDNGVPPAASSPAVSGPQWRRLLQEHPGDVGALVHSGLACLAEGDTAGARKAWESAGEDPWALRHLAHLDRSAGDHAGAAERLVTASAQLPGIWQLTAETLSALLAAGRPGDALAIVDGLDPVRRSRGRIRLYAAMAALDAGDVPRAKEILHHRLEVADLREGEDSLEVLWAAYQHAAGTDEPLPPHYDFSMR